MKLSRSNGLLVAFVRTKETSLFGPSAKVPFVTLQPRSTAAFNEYLKNLKKFKDDNTLVTDF